MNENQLAKSICVWVLFFGLETRIVLSRRQFEFGFFPKNGNVMDIRSMGKNVAKKIRSVVRSEFEYHRPNCPRNQLSLNMSKMHTPCRHYDALCSGVPHPRTGQMSQGVRRSEEHRGDIYSQRKKVVR